MQFPTHYKHIVIGAGIHGLSMLAFILIVIYKVSAVLN